MNAQKIDKAVEASIEQLKKSQRGRQALADFKTMMDNGATSLDSENGTAICALMLAVFKAGMREFISDL